MTRDRNPGRDSIRNAIRRRSRDQRGQVLPIVVIMMAVFLGLLALAVDLGSYDQAQRQTQATADAAALAGSYDLPTSTTLATTDAQKYVTSNFPGVPLTCTAGQPGTCITFPTATPVNSQIKVVVTASTPTFFGKFLGLTNEAVGASAVASNTTSTACATVGNGCYALFAMDTTCSSTTGIFFNGGGYTFQGGIHSNGSVTATGGGSTFSGPVTYGAGTGCLNTTATLPSGSGPEAAVATWPINYATDFPACGGTGTACNATGTPSYCSASAASFTFTGSSPPLSGYIYCAYGTGTKSTPTTWTGTITFSGGAIGSSGSPVVASYIAGNVITGSGGEFFATCGYSSTAPLSYTASACKGASGQTMPAPATANYPLIYATDTLTPNNVPSGDTYAVNLGGGGNTWQGDIFAPTGQVVVAAGSQTTGFIEAWDIGFVSGGIFQGDGPSDSGTTSSPGSESLVQ